MQCGFNWNGLCLKLLNICKGENLKDPVIEEQFDPDRTIITLSLEKKQAIIASYIGLSTARTRAILSEMKEVEALGKNRNRTYRIK